MVSISNLYHIFARLFTTKSQLMLPPNAFRLHIHQLNDDCLCHILDHLPLATQLRVAMVCSKWNHLVNSLCRRRKTLVLSYATTSTHRAVVPSMNIEIEHYAGFHHY